MPTAMGGGFKPGNRDKFGRATNRSSTRSSWRPRTRTRFGSYTSSPATKAIPRTAHQVAVKADAAWARRKMIKEGVRKIFLRGNHWKLDNQNNAILVGRRR